CARSPFYYYYGSSPFDYW
nr:immunoglobulin heavy chain junction region [Mus musculus]